jgi:hypothetical protein
MDDIDKRAAELLARLEAEREQRIADKIEAGELLEVPLCIVGGSETSVRAQVEAAKADKLKELRAADDRREVVFRVNTVVTGVVQHGEPRDPDRPPTAPGFASGEDTERRHHDVDAPLKSQDNSAGPRGARCTSDAVLESRDNSDPPPPLIETPICVQVGRCRDDDDPGEVVEGYFSVDGSTVTVTDSKGREIGSRAMLEGEDARVVAKRLLREKAPESEDFNRVLSYPNAGLA